MKNLIAEFSFQFLPPEARIWAQNEKEFCLACIAGGETPEEIAARFGIDLRIINKVIAGDLARRR